METVELDMVYFHFLNDNERFVEVNEYIERVKKANEIYQFLKKNINSDSSVS